MLSSKHPTVKLVYFATSFEGLREKYLGCCSAPGAAEEEKIEAEEVDEALSAKGDVWSCGVILCLIMTGRLPSFHDPQVEGGTVG
jgi:serine/threonine protein kinase